MKVIIFLGPPGAGKGTQCSLLSSRLKNVKHISTGALIRQEIASKSELGLKVKELVEAGSLVDDDNIIKCLKSSISSMHLTDEDIILFDGIPRNLQQASDLDNFLKEFNAKVDHVISLTADLNELVGRFAKRWTCSACNNVESIQDSGEISKYVCTKCGKIGSMLRRKDDEPETIKKRFLIYNNETAPLISHYTKQGTLCEVDGLKPLEHVYAEIISILIKN